MKRRALLLALRSRPLSAPLAAAGFGLFQHGGRGAAQVGAFVARADDPSAVRYNPAGVARLEGFQLRPASTFRRPRTNSTPPDQSDLRAPHHPVPSRALRHLEAEGARAFPLTFGLEPRRAVLDDHELGHRALPRPLPDDPPGDHPLRAPPDGRPGRSTSAGVSAARCATCAAAIETSFATFETLPVRARQTCTSWKIKRQAATQVDGLGFDLGVQYTASSWGWGAVLRIGRFARRRRRHRTTFPREPFSDPAAEAAFNRRFVSSSASMNFELPPTASIGVWWGITDSLKLEGRHRLERLVGARPHPHRDRPAILTVCTLAAPAAIERDRDWKDVRQPAPRRRVGPFAACGRWAAASPSSRARCPTRPSSPASPGRRDRHRLRRFLQSATGSRSTSATRTISLTTAKP